MLSMLDPIVYVYEKILKKGILNSSIPVNHVLLVLDESDLLSDTTGMEQLRQFINWCYALKIKIISVYIGVIRDGVDKNVLEKAYSHLTESITKMLSEEQASIAIYTDGPEPTYEKSVEGAGADNEGDMRNKEREINISIGLGGRSELTKAIKEIVKKVKAGVIEPEVIDEKLIESELIFKSDPDLVIRSGTTRLTDFLIWQSVYSEFYFTDINWRKFRKIDLLRAVRDFQLRKRRFGR
uniref:Tritrans,polycis-undecaprenyl-diphosphate synthase (GGDP specific) n=1 Tax=Candidatus Methanophagaceae archaeon ANME-1 ERB6 TaxID=2759912 RepID=A0A7G9YRU0_9EURY|nr:tritrans,polycis-undecaprenyl-diphosphate synthase (GGDP specific) [Methanosarcinales archaeon ANME-1 ERB6]